MKEFWEWMEKKGYYHLFITYMIEYFRDKYLCMPDIKFGGNQNMENLYNHLKKKIEVSE